MCFSGDFDEGLTLTSSRNEKLDRHVFERTSLNKRHVEPRFRDRKAMKLVSL